MTEVTTVSVEEYLEEIGRRLHAALAGLFSNSEFARFAVHEPVVRDEAVTVSVVWGTFGLNREVVAITVTIKLSDLTNATDEKALVEERARWAMEEFRNGLSRDMRAARDPNASLVMQVE